MGRIADDDRLPMLDGFIGHWTQADALGTPIEIAPGFGQPQLVALRDQYHDKREEIENLKGELSLLLAERDAIFGTSHADQNGVWFRLRQYKPMVRLKMGVNHPLSKTVPNLGDITPKSYQSILHRFLNHWTRVDAALVTPLTLGTFGIADLQAAHDSIEDKRKAIEATDEGALPLARAEREKLFGDVPEDERDDESIVARLQLYTITIQTQFPGDPIADSLPDIFPSTSPPDAVPTFRFNWVAQTGGELKTWLEVPTVEDPSAFVFLKEGAMEQLEPLDPSAPDGVQVITWNGITIIDELDEFEVHGTNGVTLARGERDTSFAEPVMV